MTAEDASAPDSWQRFCGRLAAAGDRLLRDVSDPTEQAEGVHHLANQVACWLTYAVGYADPAHPAFFRSSDPTYQWGGPNADQVARRAAIDGRCTYRITGTMGSCEEFILQIKTGASQSGGAGVVSEVSASELDLTAGDSIDLVLSSTRVPGRWIELHPDAAFVHIRDYYFDWQPTEPATFVIEQIEPHVPPRPARTAALVAAVLDDAAREIEHSIEFWSSYQDRMLAGSAANEFTLPRGAAGGVQAICYSHAGVALRADQALLLELDPDDAPLWDVQLYNRPWYEALDFAYRATNTNHRLSTRDDDGKVRIVIAASDPGSANWLDTEGRHRVLATVRWWNPIATPSVRSSVRGLSTLSGPVDAASRREQIRRRAAHAAWRYRT